MVDVSVPGTRVPAQEYTGERLHRKSKDFVKVRDPLSEVVRH